MIFEDKNGNDYTWAIIKQMQGELTHYDVLGILKTHEENYENI
tara:strand:+ start:396 stop:524 length:129 start_codon:yes stop_codon:yes gene_type:complete